MVVIWIENLSEVINIEWCKFLVGWERDIWGKGVTFRCFLWIMAMNVVCLVAMRFLWS